MSQLSASRPDIPYGMIWCGLCNCACDFDEGGLHNLFGRRDGPSQGYILIRAYCHGEEADLKISFKQARQNAGGRIMAFLPAESYLPAAPIAIDGRPLMLLEKNPS